MGILDYIVEIGTKNMYAAIFSTTFNEEVVNDIEKSKRIKILFIFSSSRICEKER